MREVAILGIGQTRVDEHWEKSLREIGGEAAFAALQDDGVEKVEALYVGNMLSGIGWDCGDRKRSKWRRPAARARRLSAPR